MSLRGGASVEASMEPRRGFTEVSMEVRGGLHKAPWRSVEASMDSPIM